jgi:hypothetical protein
MITYFLNWMGPVANRWYTERGLNPTDPKDRYATGRIDIHIPDEYNKEYGVYPMKAASWNKLGDWLWTLETEKVLGKSELFQRFEEETGHKIEWWENE